MKGMRRFLAILICVVFAFKASAQVLGPLYGGVCAVEYAAGWQGDTPYVTVVVSSESLVFDESPVLMFRLFDGERIRLEGRTVAFWTIRGGAMKDGEFEPSTTVRSVARFPLTLSELEMLRRGVEKVRLSTLPQMYEKTFRRDRIGGRLYDGFAESIEDRF